MERTQFMGRLAMAIATKAQIQARQDKIAKLRASIMPSKKLQAGVDFSAVISEFLLSGIHTNDIFEHTLEKKLLSIVRSEIRKTWMRHPIKLLFLEEGIELDTDPDTRTIWKVRCQCCNQYHKLGDIEVDHIKGEHSLKSFEDIKPFAISILQVSFNDLQRICKSCHLIKTYAERYGHSFEDAKLILSAKHKLSSIKTPALRIKFLVGLGIPESELKSEAKRILAYIKYLKG